jgi:4-hydroxy-3-methylbut-2-enyl diphosphate reductase IspH
MVEVIVAPHAGFCFGVKRAIALAERVSVERMARGYGLWDPSFTTLRKSKG